MSARRNIALTTLAVGAMLTGAAPTLAQPAYPGDVDGDGFVGLADLAALLSSYYRCSGQPEFIPDADFDNDGCVDLADLAALLANYDTTPPPAGMVDVPAGWFEMGDPWEEGAEDELPVHGVWVSRFRIDKYEVTNEHYAQFLNAGGNDEHWDSRQLIQRQVTSDTYLYAPLPDYENHPVVFVSYVDALAFCEWRAIAAGMPIDFFRLPTEAEWEKAAGWDPIQKRHFRFGFQEDLVDCTWGNFSYCVGAPTEVGHFDGTGETSNAVSSYGCYDMSGNVWEWCHDWYSEDYYAASPDTDPTGPATGTSRVARGGSWPLSTYNCRTSNRNGGPAPTLRGEFLGFRCVAGTN